MNANVIVRFMLVVVAAAIMVPALTGRSTGHAQSSPSNIVSEWNAVAAAAPIGPLEALAYLALVHLAIYDAVVAIEGGYEPFAYTTPGNPEASAEAAAATAAYRTVIQLLPGAAAQAEALHAQHLAAIPDGAAKTGGIAIGEAAAAAVIALPLASQVAPGTPYTPIGAPGPGVWEPTSPTPALGTWAPLATPLTMASASQFRPGPPPSLDSDEWVAAFNEIRDYGGAGSTFRTAEQTETGLYYAEQPAHQPNKSFRRFLADHELDLVESARYMAMVSTGIADALIACFDAKYHYQFWRPIQSVPGDDGNPATESDAEWLTTVPATPNHPEYPAAHSCVTSTWSLLTAEFLGTSQINFTGETTVDGRQPRFWPTVQDALDDVANGRIWGGVHYRFSTVAGAEIARQVAENIIATRFGLVADQAPAPQPPSTGTGTEGAGPPIPAVSLGFLAILVTLPFVVHAVRRRTSARR